MWWNSGIVMEEECWCNCGGTVMVEQCGGTVWWNSVVEQWKSDARTVWSKSGKVLVEQCGGTVWWKSGTVLWNSGTVMVEQCGGTLEQ